MHIKGKNSWLKHFDFILINTFSLVISFVIAYLLRFGDFSFLEIRNWKVFVTMIALFNLVALMFLNTFSGIFHRPSYEDVLKQIVLTIYSVVLSALFFYILRTGIFYSRLVFGYTFVIYFVISCILIHIRKKLILSGRTKPRNARERSLFVVSETGKVEEALECIYASDFNEYNVVGFSFTDGRYDSDKYNGDPVIRIEDLESYISSKNIDDVFVYVDPEYINRVDYKRLADNGVTVHIDIDSITGGEVDDQFITRIGISKTLSVGPFAYDAKRVAYMIFKRFLDIIFSIIGCILTIPIMIIVKLSYLKSGDHESILYYQTRVGQYGKVFKLYKFRSMVPDADKVLEELLKDEKYKKQWDENQKFDDDPRITKIGRFLRKTSLDEFPQFFNILKGDMSLVGPRPLVVGELEEHNGLTLYNKVKPGITGWWGCNGRSNINYKERLELEYYYVKNCSLSLDLICVARTVQAVLKKEGAQ